ncbi:MAG: exodeoxyribonuclease V subunit alpha [Desulfamplus sp.]|nr:exodeoxyribonuclease V subunit alpha [Desulfamplus sp.]
MKTLKNESVKYCPLSARFSKNYRHLPGFREIDFQFADFMVRLSLGNPPLERDIPGNPPLERNIPGNPPLERDIPGNPPLERDIPGNPPLERDIPGNPPLERDIPQSRPLEDPLLKCLFECSLLLSYMTGLQNSALDLRFIEGRPIEWFLDTAPCQKRPPGPGVTAPGVAAPGVTAPGMTAPGIVMPSMEILKEMLMKSKAVISSPCSGTPSPGDHCSDNNVTPMILDSDGLLYLNRYWHYENRVASAISMRASLDGPLPQDTDLVNRLFPASKGDQGQKLACITAFQSGFTVISGGPGTGKTTTVSKLLALLLHEEPDLKIDLVAPTGKAADRLVKSIQSAKGSLNIPLELKARIPEKASTIHRYLKYLPSPGTFRHNRANPRTSDVLVVDEASMVSLPLFAHLLDALLPSAKIILLGDKDQLSSVENGSVFADISARPFINRFSPDFIEKNRNMGLDLGYPPPTDGKTTLHHRTIQDDKNIPDDKTKQDDKTIQNDKTVSADNNGVSTVLTNRVIHLEYSYRFGPDSGIGYLSFLINHVDSREDAAHVMELIRTGRPGSRALSKIIEAGKPEPSHLPFKDITWHDISSPKVLFNLIEKTAKDKFSNYLKAVASFEKGRSSPEEVLDSFDHFRILCAVNGGPFGVEAVNGIMESALFGRKKELFYPGRPIMVLNNDYTQQLFNGDTGIILTGSDGETRAWFRGEGSGSRAFAPAFLPGHATAFAMTIHKSQGSEFDEVFMILPGMDVRILTREIIYTGITRAKSSITLAGVEKIFQEAVIRRTRRMSGLEKKLGADCP